MDKLMEFLPFMLQGAVVTIELFALTIVISLPLGLPIALGSNSRIKPLSIICKIYVWIFRGTPLLLQLFFFYFFFTQYEISVIKLISFKPSHCYSTQSFSIIYFTNRSTNSIASSSAAMYSSTCATSHIFEPEL